MRWTGYGSEDDTWEPATNIPNHLIDEFYGSEDDDDAEGYEDDKNDNDYSEDDEDNGSEIEDDNGEDESENDDEVSKPDTPSVDEDYEPGF